MFPMAVLKLFTAVAVASFTAGKTVQSGQALLKSVTRLTTLKNCTVFPSAELLQPLRQVLSVLFAEAEPLFAPGVTIPSTRGVAVGCPKGSVPISPG